jgi:D-sedoheptulose 7-phosphate isomerase
MHRVDQYLNEFSEICKNVPRPALAAIEEALWQTYRRDSTTIVCGNGGSAATASHFASDLSKWTLSPGQPRLRALALTDNMPTLTAWGNDAGYENVFVEPLKTLYRPGDTLFAISGSGNSPNVLRAVEWANAQGAATIGITGFDGGRLARLATLPLIVPSNLMTQVEDVHMAICSALAVSLGERIAAQ